MTVHQSGQLLPIETAIQTVLDSCEVLPTRHVDLGASIGCIVAEEIRARENLPPFANSAVDGYAVRAMDTQGARPDGPIRLKVIGEIAAGADVDLLVDVGQAARIMTGAPIPAGADSVVMVEETRLVDADRLGAVEILSGVSVGAAVRAAGDDVRRGEVVFAAGTSITPMVAGVMASLNCRRPLVHPRPIVGVFSTGDELVDDGSPLARGQIRESNRIMLLGLLEQSGAEGVDMGIVRDDEDALEEALRKAAARCDAIVTSGGVSMGDYDVVKAVLGRVAEMSWMQIAIKPAKPFAFGLLAVGARRVPVFGLPGNPVSSMVSFELLARPALRKMAGYPPTLWRRQPVQAVADEQLRRSADGKVHYQRVLAHFAEDGRVHVAPVRAQGSHQLAASAAANALAILPDGDGVEPGQHVAVLLLVS